MCYSFFIGNENQWKKFKKGEVIFREGEFQLWMNDLLYGKVALCVDYGTDEDVMVSRNEAPAFFGEVGLLESLLRFATAVALEESVCRIIRHEELSEYFIKNRQRSSACFKSFRKALHSIQTLQRGVPYLRRVRHNGKERQLRQ